MNGPIRKIPKGCVYWFTADTIWSTYDVVFTTPEFVPELEDWWGYTDTGTGFIYIHLEILSDQKRLVAVLLHEMTHGAVSGPGSTALLARILGCKEDVVDAREESICTHFIHPLAHSLVEMGMISLPPLPPGVEFPRDEV